MISSLAFKPWDLASLPGPTDIAVCMCSAAQFEDSTEGLNAEFQGLSCDMDRV